MESEFDRANDHSENDESTRMPYVVVARRYRPQSFEQLIGQQLVAQALKNAIETNRVGHAYLFTGARGVGKTSAARILAKALNCQSGPSPAPCNQCDICESIASGEDVDVIEIDGASNRGIDEIRQLRTNVNVRPSRARSKIYIIDEVHMLTREAFNGLLKTLEEPPEHVKFIFCTTDPEKIPITVLSRCQRFDFAPVETNAIVDRLREIVVAEGASAEREALEILARRAAGSMRDSQSLLEQLLSFAGRSVTVEDVHGMLGTARNGRLSELITHLTSHDAAAALRVLHEALAEGVDVGQLTEQLLGYLRDMMAAAVGCGPELMHQISASEYPEVKAAAENWGTEALLAATQIVDHSIARMRYSVNTTILAEMAIVRIAHLADLDGLSDLIGQLSESDSRGKANRVGPPPSKAVEPDRLKKKLDEDPSSASDSTDGSSPSVAACAEPVAETSAMIELTQGNAASVWLQALTQLTDMTADFAGKFKSVAISAPNRLAVSFQRKYNANKDYCERPERRARLEKALASVVGRPVSVEFILADDEAKTLDSGGRVEAISPRQRIRQAYDHQLVQRAVELFDAEVIRVDQTRSGGQT